MRLLNTLSNSLITGPSGGDTEGECIGIIFEYLCIFESEGGGTNLSSVVN